MGRIKLLMVKRAAQQLLQDDLDFNEDFDHNKKMLGNTMPSKSIRNKIAGYISRLIRVRKTGPRPRRRAELEQEYAVKTIAEDY